MLLDWTVIFLIIALIAAFFGYSGIAAESAAIAKILFFIFLIVFGLTFLMRILQGRNKPPL